MRGSFFSSRRILCLLLLLLLPSLLGTSLAVILWTLPYAATVRFNLTVSQFAFEFAGGSEAKNELLRSLNANSIGFSNIQAVTFEAIRLRVGDPDAYDPGRGRFPDSAWKPITLDNHGIIFHGKEAPSLPFFRISSSSDGTLELDPVRVAVPSRVVLGVPEVFTAGIGSASRSTGRAANIEIPHQLDLIVKLEDAAFNVRAHGPVQIETTECQFLGSTSNSSNQTATYAVDLDPKEPRMGVSLRSGSSSLSVTPQLDSMTNLLAVGSLSLSHLELWRSIPNVTPQTLDRINRPTEVSSLVPGASNRLAYVDFPQKKVEDFQGNEFLHVGDSDVLTLTQLSISSRTGALEIELRGKPSKLYATSDSTGSRRGLKNYRMSLLEYTVCSSENNPVRLIAAVGVWLLGTTLGAYRLLKELKKDTAP